MNPNVLALAKMAGFTSCTPAMRQMLTRFADEVVAKCTDINKQELSFAAFAILLERYQEFFGVDNEAALQDNKSDI